MANYDIDGFIGQVGAKGFARGNLFTVYVDIAQLDQSWVSGTSITTADLAMQAQSVELPTKALLTKEIFTQNIPNPMGYNLQYSDLTINFLLDNNTDRMTIWGFFNTWMNRIVNPYNTYVGYKKDYSCPIYVSTIGTGKNVPKSPDHSFGANKDTHHKSVAVKFVDCFPKTLGQASLDYSNAEVIKFPVTFAIRHFEDVKIDTDLKQLGSRTGVIGSAT
tara:strand:- start:192 stop:848 length:657 start_codon:yes stop_codon:yes gene_type:complete